MRRVVPAIARPLDGGAVAPLPLARPALMAALTAPGPRAAFAGRPIRRRPLARRTIMRMPIGGALTAALTRRTRNLRRPPSLGRRPASTVAFG